jgi:hypothetical protein
MPRVCLSTGIASLEHNGREFAAEERTTIWKQVFRM